MSNQKPKLLLIGLTIAGWSMIFDTLLPKSSALGATLNFNVSVNGKTLGNITLDEALGSNGGRGLEGGFTPTGMTIPDLLAYLGTAEINKMPPQKLNWLQVVTNSYYPTSVTGSPIAPFIDPIKGGFSRQWSDNEPWYYDEYKPNPLPSNKEPYDENYLRVLNTTSSKLNYLDIVRQSLGTKLTFNTFLVADYGDKTYRPIGDGFEWSIEVQPPAFPNPQFPEFGITRLTSPPASVKYEPSLFDSLVSAFGYTRRPTPLVSKTFSGTLAAGQKDNYKLDQLTPGSKYTAWTNNDLPSNQCNPNTFLTASSPNGSIVYDDNSSPVGNGFASGLTGTVGNSGSLNLAVQAANRRGQDKGNYELFVNVYEPDSPSFSNGNSGGGGVSKEMRGLTQQNPILPTSVQNGWQTFNKVPGCRWYDPHTTYGFEFQSLEDTLFTEILDFPVGEDTEFAVTVGNVLLGNFGAGDSVDFVSLLGGGVSNFKITGIDSLIGSTAETAFPIQLAFDKPEGSFQMRAFSEDDPEEVPEPATVLGTLLALGGLGTIKKFKNRN